MLIAHVPHSRDALTRAKAAMGGKGGGRVGMWEGQKVALKLAA